MGERALVQNRLVRTAAAIAVAGSVAACAAGVSTPVASNGTAPAAAKASASVATPAPVAPVASEARHIVVRPGQSVNRIAAEYGLPKRAIIAANHLTPPYKIKTGQRLLIPGSAEAPPTPVKSEPRHIVVPPGRSVSGIAVEYHVPKSAIIAANHLTPPYKIKTGQRLLIPGPAGEPPAPVAAGSPPPTVIPLDGPAPPKSTTLPPAAPSPATAPPAPGSASPTPTPVAAAARPLSPEPSAAGQASAASALKPVGVVVPAAGNNSPVAAEPLQAPVASAPTMMTGKPPAPSGSAKPPESATTAAAPPPAPALVPAAAPPGVTCPPGTIGMLSERDVTKTPVYICHQLHPQE